jgi:hypothetical protein
MNTEEARSLPFCLVSPHDPLDHGTVPVAQRSPKCSVHCGRQAPMPRVAALNQH